MLKGLGVGSFRLYVKTLVMFFMCTIYENNFSRLEEFEEKNEVLGSLKFIFLFFLKKTQNIQEHIYRHLQLSVHRAFCTCLFRIMKLDVYWPKFSCCYGRNQCY